MKRLYTIALSTLVLAASASVAVPMVKPTRSQSAQAVEQLQRPSGLSAQRAAKHTAVIQAQLQQLQMSASAKKLSRIESDKVEAIEFGVNSISGKPAKVMSKVAAAPSSIEELVAGKWEMSYSGASSSNAGTHSGIIEFTQT